VYPQETVDFECLFLANEGYNTETCPVSEFILLILRLLKRRSRE
jgi:hypothetical protein